MNVPRPQSRSERRKARTVAAILEAAERHLLERGYEDARVDEIAADADVAVGSVYNHFGSKEGLYLALAERALELHDTYMADAPRDDRTPLEQLLNQAGGIARFGRERPGQLRVLAFARGAGPERSDVRELVGRHLRAHELRTAALVEAAIRRGEIRPLNARDVAAFLWSAWLGMFTVGPGSERAASGDERSMRAVIEAGLRIVIGGLASDDARASNDLVRAILEFAPVGRSPTLPSPTLRRAPVARELRVEHPGLCLWTVVVDAARRATPVAVARRLRDLAGPAEGAAAAARPTGATATGVPSESLPWAYRVFARRLGVDPDAPRPVPEAIALQRLGEAASASGALLDDALAVAALETGVPILAFDADRLDGALHLRPTRTGETLPGGRQLGEGEVVVADRAGPLAALFKGVAPERAAGPATSRVALAAIQVSGVPDVGVQQALWTVAEILAIEGRDRG